MYPQRKPSILLVEDDVRLAYLVRQFLETAGFTLTIVDRGMQVLDRVQLENPDLVILDLGLPDCDGLTLCKLLRPVYLNPILILTARGNDIDHVLGLELGADDYVIKPVEPQVLAARVRALLRRPGPPTSAEVTVLRIGALRVEKSNRAVYLHGSPIDLTRPEYNVLVHLAEQAGVIQSRESLFQQLYGREYDGVDRSLDITISRLRKKIGDEKQGPDRIKTIWGEGYLLVPDAW